MGELTLLNHIDFAIQWVIIAVAAYGYYMVRYSQERHGWSLFAATLTNLGAIIILMTPRLISHIPEIDLLHPTTHATIIVVHSAIGGMAAAVSAMLIFKWRAVNFRLGRCRRQDLMALSFITWMIAAGVGIFGYLRHTFNWFP